MAALRFNSFCHASRALLQRLRPLPLMAPMQTPSSRTRSFGRRKLDFEKPKLAQLGPAPRSRKRPLDANPGVPCEPLISELDEPLLRTDGQEETQKKCASTYRRRSSRQVLGKNLDAAENEFCSSSALAREADCRGTADQSSDESLSSSSSSKILMSDLQVVAYANAELSAVDGAMTGSELHMMSTQPLRGEAARPGLDSEKKTMQSFCGDVSPHTAGFTTADLDASDMSSCLLPHVDTAILYEGPYPSFPRPSPEECTKVCQRLSLLHGPLEEYAHHKVARLSSDKVLMLEYHKEEDRKDSSGGALSVGLETSGRRVRRSVLDSLVGTILSQNTTDKNSQRAFASLKAKFPTWESVYKADPKVVEEAIRCGGLAEIKTSRILNILRTLDQERGKICLEYVRKLSADEIKLELSRFKGVGPKTIACVLMFHLQQDEFPVDTHVFRITKMLGWVPAKADREKAYLHLNHRIPDHLKFDLHCLLVTHGKRCPRCAKGGRTQRPADGPCPLVNLNQELVEASQCGLLPEP